MRGLKATYTKDGGNDSVRILAFLLKPSNDDLVVIYVDKDGEIDKDEKQYFTVQTYFMG